MCDVIELHNSKMFLYNTVAYLYWQKHCFEANVAIGLSANRKCKATLTFHYPWPGNWILVDSGAMAGVYLTILTINGPKHKGMHHIFLGNHEINPFTFHKLYFGQVRPTDQAYPSAIFTAPVDFLGSFEVTSSYKVHSDINVNHDFNLSSEYVYGLIT